MTNMILGEIDSRSRNKEGWKCEYFIIRSSASDLASLDLSSNGKRKSNGLNFFIPREWREWPTRCTSRADPVWVMRLDLGFDSTPMTGFHGASTGSYHLPATMSAIHHNYAVESITEMDQSGVSHEGQRRKLEEVNSSSLAATFAKCVAQAHRATFDTLRCRTI